MKEHFIHIQNLTFTYDSAVESLFNLISLQFEKGWTGIVGPNGSGKSTLLKIITGDLKPDSGTMTSSNSSIYCEQRTDKIPNYLQNLFDSYDKNALKIKQSLELQSDWLYRWGTLSHGERKRCQIAVALYKNPDVLAIDEPSNHLDSYVKMILFNALKSYNGIGLIVSHDRELLDNLCHHTLFLDPPTCTLRKGNYSTTAEELQRENDYQHHHFEIKKKEIKKLKKEVQRRKQNVMASNREKSKRGINPKDHDAKSKIDLIRLSGKDAVEGKIYSRLKSRLDKKQESQQSIQFKKSSPMGISFQETKIYKEFIFQCNSGKLSLGKEKSLLFPDLFIRKGERIGFIGENGSGKSSFLEYIVPKMTFPQDQIIYIPQEISDEDSKNMMQSIQNISKDQKGFLMSVISHLGSEPNRLLNTMNPSPGEVRKLMLAEGILKNPILIIMDEPTNHMDLPSIQCVENALSEGTCALLLVSHDNVFLQNLVETTWSISKSSDNDNYFLKVL